jgi:hypothetical protein
MHTSCEPTFELALRPDGADVKDPAQLCTKRFVDEAMRT